MVNFKSRIVQFVTKQPLLAFACALGLLSIVIFILTGLGGNDSNAGDYARPGTGSFLVYDNQPFNPFGVVKTDNMLRKDVEYFARNVEGIYNSNTESVVFEVKDFERSNASISITGKYYKTGGEVSISAERVGYDLVKTSISWNGSSIDAELPSASERNIFIQKLPIEEETYQISYSVEGDVFIITPTEAGNKPLNDARNLLKTELGEDYSEESYTINYPAYLKGSPPVNSTRTYTPEDTDHRD